MNVGDRLPDLTLLTAAEGRVELRAPRSGAPLLLLPPAAAGNGRTYLEEFLAAADEISLWDAAPLVVVGSPEQTRALGGAGAAGEASPRLALDPEGKLRERLGVEANGWGLIVADRWGVVYHAQKEARAEALPDPPELLAWARFLATQCPECGVIDEPDTGGWNPP